MGPWFKVSSERLKRPRLVYLQPLVNKVDDLLSCILRGSAALSKVLRARLWPCKTSLSPPVILYY